MAGGSGSRLDPLTKAVNKHMLPIYNKPLIYYPLTTLILAGVKSVTVVTSSNYLTSLENLLGDGREFGIRINYVGQAQPRGIVQGILLSEDFIKGNKFALILGDNLFHGVNFGQLHGPAVGAKVFAQMVSNPHDYGVAEICPKTGQVLSLEEKPLQPKSNLAVTGIYFFDGTASERSRSLIPSARGELEIVDLLKTYVEDDTLGLEILPEGTVWMDTGSFDSMFGAADYIKLLQDRLGALVGSPDLLAFELGYLSKDEFRMHAEGLRTSTYGRKLLERIELAS